MNNQEIIQMLIDSNEPMKMLNIFVKMTEDEKDYITKERIRIDMVNRMARKKSKTK
jgi:hypothetical protein